VNNIDFAIVFFATFGPPWR